MCGRPDSHHSPSGWGSPSPECSALPSMAVQSFRTTKHSLFRSTEAQEETGGYLNAMVVNCGQGCACGWCNDWWGLPWQITPRVLTEALAVGGKEARRAFDAMMGMKIIDVAAIKDGAERSMNPTFSAR